MHPLISEEGLDTVMSSDGEGSGPFMPPPRIAARIFKDAATRRKTSAASSRRNSLTSHHSSRSARSGHGRPLSTQVAQHLRRASIIESRKAKAADRNAHAEQVRLRAAMNKAAPRVTANSEARALAAQKARDRYLAQVKANCAEEVKRSKRVAEEQREKRAAEQLRLKEEVEERHAEAEKRKALLQRRPRTATNPSGDEALCHRKQSSYVWKPASPSQAASVIQRAWRRARLQFAVKEFKQSDLSLSNVQKMEFEDVGELLGQELLILRTGRVLDVMGMRKLGGEGAQDQAQSDVRTFLSSYLILGHPAHVLNNDTEQEQDLIAKARDLLSHFSQILESPSVISAIDASQLAVLRQSFTDYRAAFATWRSYDSNFMIQGMVAQFVELDAIWELVKLDQDGCVAEDYKEGIQNNQAMVIARLKKMVGPEKAMKMIRDAVRKSRKARIKRKVEPEMDNKPRQAASGSTDFATPQGKGTQINAHSTNIDIDSRSASNSKYDARTATLVPPNRIVSHEIAINKEWRIDVDSKLGDRDEVISSVAAQLQRDLDQGHGDLWIPAMADTIRNKLLGLLTPGNSLHTLISGALDPSLVATQVQHGLFSYDGFFSFMNNILPQLCAPVRDPDVKTLATDPSDDPVRQLARLYFMIDVISLDNLNYRLQQRMPQLLEESSGYETRCFDKTMEGSFPEKTLSWWADTLSRTNEESARRASDTVSTSSRQATANRVYMNGLVELAVGTQPLEVQNLPETLELDHERFNRIRGDLLRIVTVSSILLTAKNLLRRDVRSLWKAEAQRMWDLPFTSPPFAYVSIVESRYALPPTTKQQLTNTISRLLNEAKDGLTNHPVMKVVLKKIKNHVLARLSASSAEERIRASAQATEILGSGGLPEFVARVRDMVAELQKVADVDRQCHGEWYEKVATRAEADLSGTKERET